MNTLSQQIYGGLRFFYFKYYLKLLKFLKKKFRFLFDLSDPRIGIGNVICVTPAIAAVKELYPNSTIDVILRYKDLLKGWKTVDNLYDDHNYGEDRYDGVFIHELGKESSRINSIKLDVVVGKNEVCYHFEKIQHMGYAGVMPGLYVSSKPVDMFFSKDRLKIGIIDCGKSENFALNGESKSWPYYDELIKILLENYNCQIYLIGGPYEEGKMKITGEHIENCIGKYTLPETASILKNCDIAVGNDCGPMRIADAVGVKHYVIWGPTSEVKNGYLNNYFNIYNEKIECRPCQGKNKTEKCQHLACLYGIKPEDVISSIEELRKWKK